MSEIKKRNFDIVNDLRGLVGIDYIEAVAFLTYVVKTMPLGIDFADAEANWFKTDNFSDGFIEYESKIQELQHSSNKIVSLLAECLAAEMDVVAFFMDGPNNRKLFNVTKELTNNSIEDLKEIAINCFQYNRKINEGVTATSVAKLAKRILNIKKDDTVADLCSGTGNFLSLVDNTDNLTGLEINYDYLMQSIERCALNNIYPHFIQHDLLTWKNDKFDKVFCEYPWGMIYERPIASLKSEKWEPLPVTDIKRSNISWVFIAKVLSCLKENGIAVVHCNAGALFSTYEKPIRKLALEKGLIKAVIELPAGINVYTGLRSCLLVLSIEKTEKIHFIDASKFGTRIENKRVIFSEDDIKRIVELLETKENSSICAIEDYRNVIVASDSNLSVSRFLQPEVSPISIKFPKKMNEVLLDIIKSCVQNSKFLTEDSSSGIRVLSSSDIKDGHFNVDELPYLSLDAANEIKNIEKYYLEENDVVMTNKSTVIKSAITHLSDEKVVLFGSLYGLKVDTNKMSPMFLNAFINSDSGQMILKTIQTGTVIAMITVANLKNCIIPCPSLQDQFDFVEKYKILEDMLFSYRAKTQMMEQELSASFDSLTLEK